MSPNDRMSSMVMSSFVVCALKDNPLYNAFLVVSRDLTDVDFDEPEKRVMDYYYERILLMEDTHKMGGQIFTASDISGALNCVFCSGCQLLLYEFADLLETISMRVSIEVDLFTGGNDIGQGN